MRKLLKFIALSLNLLAVLALLTAYISGYISPEKWWIPSFFGLAYPVILGINLFFVLFWLILSPRYAVFSLLTILAGWGVLSRYVQLQGKSVERGDIKILSFNVHHFRGNGDLSAAETAAEITRFLKEQRPDIICLQEARLRQNTIFNLAKTVEDFDFINHYQFARTSSTFGSVTLTRYPIVHMDEIRFENSRNITIYTDILIGTDTVRVFNVHLHSYGIDPKNYSIIDSGVTTEEDLKEAREMGSMLKRGFRMRASQVETIRKKMDESPYPVIVCGDLNETPTSFAYQQLRYGLKDAFVGSGKGIGRTFVNKLPALRIDYIFHSPLFESYNFKTHEFRHSDHLPVSTELVKK
ncbi:MAG: endonuclease/exonuclease/phosphatase family protein [Mariniphaga sp.]|nr:endonuclease/exonuclease/phosphatase family protein [Mariniphaga sp.]